MTYSFNEIEALSKRAARGAGLSWGMSEEAAKAARWLASHELGGLSTLADLLDQNDGVAAARVAPVALGGVWAAADGALCPLSAGAALNDCADRLASGQVITMATVSFPLLVVPFAAWAARHIGTPLRISWDSIHVDTDGKGIRVTGVPSQIDVALTKSVVCQQITDHQSIQTPPRQRGAVDHRDWARLDAFAQRTYAPATEASRLLGAGAGVSDND